MNHCGTKKMVTHRLVLRPFTYNDGDSMLENWLSNPKVQYEYGEPIYTTREEVNTLLEKWMNQYSNLDFYRWAIIEKTTDICIGQIAFCKVYSEYKIAEIEYCIGQSYWGNGYANEALAAVIQFTFENTDFLKLEAFHRINNTKSGRVLEKSCMHVTDNVQRFITTGTLPHGEICYCITKDMYK